MTRIALAFALAAAPLALAACSPDAPRAEAAPAEQTAPTAPASAFDPSLPAVTVYKSSTCGCCASWAEHLRENGFAVETVDVDDLQAVKTENGVPSALQSCHTAVVDGYVVEGHVPAADVKRLLAEAPEADGLAVPGMPIGSPGMEQGDTVQPYDVILFGDSGTTVFASH
jgi:hypothetical protein